MRSSTTNTGSGTAHRLTSHTDAPGMRFRATRSKPIFRSTSTSRRPTFAISNVRCARARSRSSITEFSPLGLITREDYSSIIDQGTAHGVRSIKLNYLGEPMAHKDVVWQVEHAKEKACWTL